MKILDNRYVKVFNYKGLDICTLKSACPTKEEELGYRIDDKQFVGQEFKLVDDAIKAIEQMTIYNAPEYVQLEKNTNTKKTAFGSSRKRSR